MGLSAGVMTAQVGMGLVLFGQDFEPGSIHMFYGVVILLTLTFVYIYRAQYRRRPALYWGSDPPVHDGAGAPGGLQLRPEFLTRNAS